MRRLILLANNVRSCYNVGALLRTADGLGVEKVFLCGYTPYPLAPNDARLPHIAAATEKQIHKTALGAEKTVEWEHAADVTTIMKQLKQEGFELVALEQTPTSIELKKYNAPSKVALIAGREVEGLEPEVLKATDITVAIPMLGQKESYNVVVAAAMALYHVRFICTEP